MPAATKSVLIVDDNLFPRRGLSELFKREADFEVCGKQRTGKKRLRRRRSCTPTESC